MYFLCMILMVRIISQNLVTYLMYGVFRYVLWIDNTVSMNSVTIMTIIVGWVMYSHL